MSPYQFYQYWINVPDADVPKLLALLTLLADEEVAELSRLRDQADHGRQGAAGHGAHRHGARPREQAEGARETSRALFGDGGATSTVNATPCRERRCTAAELEPGIPA